MTEGHRKCCVMDIMLWQEKSNELFFDFPMLDIVRDEL